MNAPSKHCRFHNFGEGLGVQATLSDQSDHFTEHFKFRRRHHVARQARSDFAANGSLPTKKKATLGLIYAPKLK
jgi:hypothetical protein